MTDIATETRSVVVERELAHPPEKIWRALTQPRLIEDWLMTNDFEPVVGHRFDLRAEWGTVACQVLEVAGVMTGRRRRPRRAVGRGCKAGDRALG